jgi:hypothetical protein
MEDLKVLVNLVSKQKIKQIDIISEEGSLSTKAKIFYDGISEGVFSDDEKAARYLYDSNPKDPNYLKLKYRLKQKLYNTLFFIDTNKSNYTDHRKALYKSHKDYITFKFLINQLSRAPAIKLGENILRNALKFDFTDIIVLLSRDLRTHYGYLDPNKSKFEKYNYLIKKYREVLDAEILAEEYYSVISNMYSGQKAGKSDSIKKTISEFCATLKSKQPHIESFLFNYFTYTLLSFKHTLSQEYRSTIDICDEAILFFSRKPFTSKLIEYSFQNNKTFCYLNTGDYDEALVNIEKNLKLIKPGTFNWFKVNNFYFIQTMLTENYQKAYELVADVTNNKKLNLFETHKESWLLKEAYINFLIKIGKIDPSKSPGKNLKKFRLYKFLNEVPLYSKDKRGLNVSILIIQLLFLIELKNYDQVLDRIDSLNQYCYRYLRNDDSLRSNCFIKMLIKLPDADYHPLRLKRYTKKVYDKFIQTKFVVSEQITEIEIIPYEKLWNIVLEILD